MMSELEFWQAIAARLADDLEIDPTNPSLDGVDSLLLVEVVLVAESLGGAFDGAWLDDVKDASDLYFYYCRSLGGDRPPPFELSSLRSPRARLRPVMPQDVPILYVMSQDPRISSTWRFRGRTPSPDMFNLALWDRVHTQFVLCQADAAEPLGLLTCFNADMGGRHAELAVMVEPSFWGSRELLDGLLIFLNYLFISFDFRKVYAEILPVTGERLGIAEHGLAVVEGQLRGHELYRGEWVDLLTFAIYREPFLTFAEQLGVWCGGQRVSPSE